MNKGGGGENWEVFVVAKLNPDLSISQINHDIQDLEKSKELKQIRLTAKLDKNVLNVLKEFNQAVKKYKPNLSVFDAGQAKKDVDKASKYVITGVESAVKKAKKQLRAEFGDGTAVIGESVSRDGKGQLKSFIIDLKLANNEIRRVNFEMVKLSKQMPAKKGEEAKTRFQTAFQSTWIKDINMTEAQLSKMNEQRQKLLSQYLAKNIKGKITDSEHKELSDNLNGATDKKSYQNAVNTNTLLLAQYENRRKNSKEMERQTALITKQIREMNKAGKVDSGTRTRMGFEFGNASKSGNLDEVINFAKKYENELNSGVGAQKKFESETTKISEKLQQLRKDEIITESTFKRYNKSLKSADNVAELNKISKALKNVEDKTKKQNSINLFQSKISDNASALQKSLSTHVDQAGLKAVMDEIAKLNVDTPNLVHKMKELNQAYQAIDKSAKAMAHSEQMMMQEAQNALRTQYQVALNKGKIDSATYQRLMANVDKATTLHMDDANKNQVSVKSMENANKILISEYESEKKISDEMDRQLKQYKQRIEYLELSNRLDGRRLTQMKSDYSKAQSSGSNLEVAYFAQNYENELKDESSMEKSFIESKRRLERELVRLGKTGRLTAQEIGSLGQSLSNATNNVHLENIRAELKGYKSVNNELVKRKQLLETKVNDALTNGNMSGTASRDMLRDYNNANRAGTLKALIAFQQKYREELGLTTPAENEKIKLQDKLRNKLIELARTNRFTTEELRKLGNALDTASTIRKLDNLEAKLKRMSDTAKETAKSEKEVADFQKRMEQRVEAIKSSPNGTRVNTRELNEIMREVRALNRETPELNERMDRLSNRLNRVNADARMASMGLKNMLFTAMQKFPVWMVSATFFYAPIRALRDMSERLLVIDTQMTELKRVLDVPDFKFSEMLQDAVVASDELATKLTDVLTIMGNFSRTGASSSDLIEITKTAQVLQNISDLDANDAVDTLTSSMINFSVSAEDSMEIVDKLNEVDNHFAISTADLAGGIRKAGASAKTFGVSLTSLIGYISAIGSTTRETGNILGTSLKTIFSRLTTMREARDALSQIGVSIFDKKGNTQDVEKVIASLAEKWQGLTQAQRENLAVVLAGRQQANRFLAMLNNYNIAVSAMATAEKSQGSAMREQEKFAESLQGRLNRLDTAWNKLTLSFGNAVLTDTLVDTMTLISGLINAFKYLADVGLGTSIVVSGMGLVFYMMNAKMRLFAKATVSEFALIKMSSIAGALGLNRLESSMLGMIGATSKLKVAMRSLLGISVVGVAFIAFGFILEKLINLWAEAQKKQEEYELQQKKSIEAMTINRTETEKLIKTYNDMTKAKNEAGGFKDEADEEKYASIQNQLAQIYPQLVKSIDGAGNAHLKSAKAIETEIKFTKALILAKKEEKKAQATKKFGEEIDDVAKKKNDVYNLRRKVKTKQEQIIDSEGNAVSIKLNDEDLAKTKTQLIMAERDFANASLKINDSIISIAHAFNNMKIDPTIKKNVEDWINTIDFSKVEDEKALKKYSQDVSKAEIAMQKALKTGKKGDEKAFQDAVLGLALTTAKLKGVKLTAGDLSFTLSDVKNNINKMNQATYSGRDGMDSYSDSVEGATDNLASWADQLKDAEKDFEKTNDIIMQMMKAKDYDEAITTAQGQAYQALADEVSPLNELMEKLADGKSISSAEAMTLIDKEHDLAKAIKVENGVVKVNEQAVLDLRNAKIKSYMDMIDAMEKEAKVNFTKTFNSLKLYKEDIAGIASVAEAKQRLAEVEDNRNKYDGDWVTRKQYIDTTTKLTGFADLIQNLDDLSTMASKGMTEVGTSAEKLSDSKDNTKKNKDVVDEFKQSLDALDLSIAKEQAIMNKYPNTSKQYQDSLKKEIQLLQQKKKAIDAHTASLDNQIKNKKITDPVILAGLSDDSSSETSPVVYPYGSSSNAQTDIWNFFKSKGFSDSATAGIMGNLAVESSFDTKAVNSKSGAYGLAQWLGGRKTGLSNYAKSQGKSISDLTVQLNYLWKELSQGYLSRMGGQSSLNKMSATEVAKIFENKFEISGGALMNKRYQNAQAIYAQHGGNSGGGGVSSSAPTLKLGSNGAWVKTLQKELGVTVDGVFGKQTLIAVKNYQKKHKLSSDGIVGSQTWNSLGVKTSSNSNTSSSSSSSSSKGSDGGSDKAIADAKDKSNDYKNQSLEIQQKIEEANMQLVESYAQAYDVKRDSYKDDLAYLDQQEGKIEKTSEAYRKLEKQRITYLTKQKEYEEGSIKTLQDQLKNNKLLTEAQKEQIRQEIIERQSEVYSIAQSIDSSNKNISDSLSDIADQTIDAMKDYYEQKKQAEIKANELAQKNEEERHKKVTDDLDKELKQYNDNAEAKLKTMQDQNETDDYDKELSDKEKERQDIQNKLNLLSLDKSLAGQAQYAEQKKLLDDKDDEIAKFKLDRKRKLEEDSINQGVKDKEDDIQKRKDLEDSLYDNNKKNLEDAQKTIEDTYDNILNDERRWSDARKAILAGNTADLLLTIQGFSTDASTSMTDLGTSIQHNVIDKLAEVTKLLNGVTNTSSTSPSSNTSSGSGTNTSNNTKPTQPPKSTPTTPTPTPTPTTPPRYYTIKQGDTMWDLAVKYYKDGSKWGKIANANPKVDYKHMKIGTKLLIPYKTGGFTGDWFGEDGRLAILHKKELVLNQGDTTNFLKAIEMLKNMNFNIPVAQRPQVGKTETKIDINMPITIKSINGTKEGVKDFFSEINKALRERGVSFNI